MRQTVGPLALDIARVTLPRPSAWARQTQARWTENREHKTVLYRTRNRTFPSVRKICLPTLSALFPSLRDALFYEPKAFGPKNMVVFMALFVVNLFFFPIRETPICSLESAGS